MPVDERQKQRGDVVTIGVRVREDDEPPVAQPAHVERPAEAAAERRHQVRQLLVLEDLRQRHPFGVHHLATQWKDGLPGTITALLGRAAGRIALDDEKLRLLPALARAVAQFAW